MIPGATERHPLHTSLPASIVARGQRRLESENYLTGGHGVRLLIESNFRARPLSELARIWQPSRLAGVTVSAENGIPFLTATQVFDLRPTPRKFLAAARTPNLSNRYVKEGWLLVTCSGSVGDSIVAYRPTDNVAVSHDLLRVVPRDEGDRGYIYAFLKSRTGRVVLRSSRYGSIVKHLEPEHLHDVPIPTVDPDFRVQCEEVTKQIVELRNEAYELVRAAEDLYSTSLGLSGLTGAPIAYARPASAAARRRRRLDAYHYNPFVTELHDALSSRSSVPLGDFTDRIFGVPRFKHVYAPTGTPYLDSEDLFKVNPELTKFIPGVTEAVAKKYFVRAGWLLMACSGQLYGLNGSAVLAGAWHEKKVVSNHVIRIVPASTARSGYLQMALGHPTLGRPLALCRAFGSEVPEIAPDDLVDIPIPRLDESVEALIAGHVEKAAALRTAADELEDGLAARVDDLLQAGFEAAPSDGVSAIPQ